jgi:hypothetical protein
MSAMTNVAVAAAAAVMVFMAPAFGSAQAPRNPSPHDQQQRTGNAASGAYGAASKSSRATRPAPRGRVSQATDPSVRVRAPDGRDLGTDPDSAIRFQLRRDSTMGGM